MLFTFVGLMMINFNGSAYTRRRRPVSLSLMPGSRRWISSQPTAEAVAIYGNRIVAVGSNEEIRKWAGAETRVIDAKKQLVLPGFNDSHVHFLSGGFQLSSVDLRDANTPEEFSARIRQFAAKLPAGRWITGGDWDHERWAGVNESASAAYKRTNRSFHA